MKRICLLGFAFALILSCSKKNNVTPANNSVKINGTDYPTVTIGNQVWTTVNYSGAGGYHSADHTYGDYYLQSQALAITLPAGWRVPTVADYSTLLGNFTTTKDNQGFFTLDASGASKLLSVTGWSTPGTNQSGFDVKPAGSFDMQESGPIFETDGQAAYFMTANSGGALYTFGCTMSALGARLEASASSGLTFNAYSLRFVKDK